MQQLPTMPVMGATPTMPVVGQVAPVAVAPVGVAPVGIAPIAQVAPVAAAVATAVAPVAAPAAPEVAQLALPQGFNIAQFAVTKVASTGTARKKPVAECTIEELRDRVTFRDVQGPNKDGVNYHMRPSLHPKMLDIACLQLVDLTAGTPANTIIVPLAYKDAIEKYVGELVAQGYFDGELMNAVKEIVADKAAKELEAKKAPVNTAAADNALLELQAQPAMGVAPVGTAPVAVQATGVAPVAVTPAIAPIAQVAVAPAMPASLAQAAPAAIPAMPGMPTMPGMPGM